MRRADKGPGYKVETARAPADPARTLPGAAHEFVGRGSDPDEGGQADGVGRHFSTDGPSDEPGTRELFSKRGGRLPTRGDKGPPKSRGPTPGFPA